MKYSSACILVLVLLVLINHQVIGQQNYATNVKTEISSDEEMIITYDIEQDEGVYDVKLSLVYSNEVIEPNLVIGDHGDDEEPGKGKRIVWYYKSDFSGDVSKVKVAVIALRTDVEPVVEEADTTVDGFEYTLGNDKAPCVVWFKLTLKDVFNIKWNFGDHGSEKKNFSTKKSPTHTYKNPGTYEVVLIVFDRNTNKEVKMVKYLTIE